MAIVQSRNTSREILYTTAEVRGPVAVKYITREAVSSADDWKSLLAGARQVNREVLIKVSPRFQRVANVNREILYTFRPIRVSRVNREFLIAYQDAPQTPAMVLQTFQKVIQEETWPTVANTISTTRALQVFQKVIQRENMPLPWSQTRVSSGVMQVVQQAATVFGQSVSTAYTSVMQVLQSDIHQHISVSMDYVLSTSILTLQQAPLPLWQSPHYALSLAQWELYRTPMGFLPRSTTTAYHTSLKVLQATPMGFLPRSDVFASQVAIKTLFAYVSPMPDQGTDEVHQNVMLALQHTDGEPEIVGQEQARQAVLLALQESEYAVPPSVTRAMSLAEVVLQKEHYESPGNMGKTSAVQSVLKVVTEDTGYQNPDVVQSQSRNYQQTMQVLQLSPLPMWQSHAKVSQGHLEWLQMANYPRPGDMIPPDKAALVGQLNITTLQHADYSPVQSATRALQLAQLTSQYLFYTPASDMAEKGLFIGQLTEAVARNISYPDPAEPVSPAFADQIAVIAAHNDDKFPDPTKEAQPGEAFLVVETIASGVDYPDPSVSLVWAEVSQVSVQKATNSSFPDPTVPVSSATLTQIYIQESTSADYPDPANTVSPAEVSQAIGQVSQASTFPNPENPASTLTVNQTLQMVAIPDVTLHGVPDYAIKHRPIITISIVYIQTS